MIIYIIMFINVHPYLWNYIIFYMEIMLCQAHPKLMPHLKICIEHWKYYSYNFNNKMCMIRFRLWVFYMIFNNISIILWQSVLLVVKTEKKLLTCTSIWQIILTYGYSKYASLFPGFIPTIIMVISTDLIFKCNATIQ